MKVETFDDVWDAIEDDPAKRVTLKARSELMMAVDEVVRGWGRTEAQAAKRLGIAQIRLNDLLRGKFNEFSLDALVEIAERAGLNVKIEVSKQS